MVGARKPAFKWFCKCVALDGELVYLVVTAHTSKEASDRVHQEYAIEYVEDILTPLEMTLCKQHLNPTTIGVQQLVPWWTSTPKTMAQKEVPMEEGQPSEEEKPARKRTRPPMGSLMARKARKRPPMGFMIFQVSDLTSLVYQ